MAVGISRLDRRQARSNIGCESPRLPPSLIPVAAESSIDEFVSVFFIPFNISVHLITLNSFIFYGLNTKNV